MEKKRAECWQTRRDFLIDGVERVGGKEAEKGEGNGREEDGIDVGVKVG